MTEQETLDNAAELLASAFGAVQALQGKLETECTREELLRELLHCTTTVSIQVTKYVPGAREANQAQMDAIKAELKRRGLEP